MVNFTNHCYQSIVFLSFIEIENRLNETQPQELFPQTLYAISELLFYINNSDLVEICQPLRKLAALHPSLSPTIGYAIANAGILVCLIGGCGQSYL